MISVSRTIDETGMGWVITLSLFRWTVTLLIIRWRL